MRRIADLERQVSLRGQLLRSIFEVYQDLQGLKDIDFA